MQASNAFHSTRAWLQGGPHAKISLWQQKSYCNPRRKMFQVRCPNSILGCRHELKKPEAK